MIKLTSQEANKILKQLKDKRDSILILETKSKYFIVASTEDAESVRPNYNFKETSERIADIDNKIRILKHALNVFNTTTTLPDCEDFTIDRCLVYLPQLTERRKRLDEMRKHLPKERVDGWRSGSNNIIEYVYLNYDVNEVEAEYQKICKTISNIQMKLDFVNNSIAFDVDLDFDDDIDI